MSDRAVLLVVVLCGCYSPRPQLGAVCDPAAQNCPGGQVCSSRGFCGLPGDDADAGIDGVPADAADPIAHIDVADGWSVALFRDFSADHQFVEIDFVDDDEMYSNQPDRLFVLDAPFAQALGVVAGRHVIELSQAGFTPHFFGAHDPDMAGQPDNLSGAVFVPDFKTTGPRILIGSTSNAGGDGSFTITSAWTIALDDPENNTRSVAYDPTGAFEAFGVPEAYLGTDHGIVRSRGAKSPVELGDVLSLKLDGASLLAVRRLPLAVNDELVRVTALATLPDSNSVLVAQPKIRLGDGQPPAPSIAWAVINDHRLMQIGPTGELGLVAETAAAAGFVWHSVASPAPPHPLAGARPTVYLLESNRSLDIDRVFVLTGP